MRLGIHLFASGMALLFAWQAVATSVPALTFEQLTDKSEIVVSGHVTRSWSDWDSEHKYIWTHYELSVSSAVKGAPGSTLEISEPGGVVGIQGMSIAGAVTYQTGASVLVFLERMPNGYLRTTGWGQGKYNLDSNGRLHLESSQRGLEIVPAARNTAQASTPLSSLDGVTLTQLRVRIAARIQSQGGKR
jgi:hypothetical protein